MIVMKEYEVVTIRKDWFDHCITQLNDAADSVAFHMSLPLANVIRAQCERLVNESKKSPPLIRCE